MNKLDSKLILEHFDNDTELFQTIVEQFSEELPKLVGLLVEACKKKSWQEVGRCAHKIHGAAANFLENPVREISKQIEVLANRNQTQGLDELCRHLETQSKELLVQLTQIRTAKAAS